MSETNTSNKPVFKDRIGAIECAVFENIAENGNKLYSVSMSKSYKDRNEQWAKTTSLNKNDIPRAILLLQKCYEYTIRN